MRQDHRRGLPQPRKKLFKHHESLTLIFIERVLLGIGPEGYTLAQLIKPQQMLFPLLVKNLQQQ